MIDYFGKRLFYMTDGWKENRLKKKRLKKSHVILTLLALALLCLCACAKTNDTDGQPEETPAPEGKTETYVFRTETPVARSEPAPLPTFTPVPKDLTQQILLLKKAGEDDAVAPLLERLYTVDESLAVQWDTILTYWDETQEEDFVRVNQLPEGLPDDASLCLVALGYKLNADGTMREELLGRLRVLLTCAKQYPNALILVTGGGTASEKLPEITEAGQMAAWLIEQGIAAERVIVEDASLSTYDNIVYSTDILVRDYPSVNSVAVITSDYHIPRGTLFFTTYFVKNGYSLRVVANAAYETGKGNTESRDVLAGGVARIYGLKTE